MRKETAAFDLSVTLATALHFLTKESAFALVPFGYAQALIDFIERHVRSVDLTHCKSCGARFRPVPSSHPIEADGIGECRCAAPYCNALHGVIECGRCGTMNVFLFEAEDATPPETCSACPAKLL